MRSSSKSLAEALSVHELGGTCSNLLASYELSEERIDFARRELRSVAASGLEGLDVVAYGSMARREMTTESDFDYLVIAHGGPESADAADILRIRADALRQEFGDKEVRKPGSTGLFGGVVAASDLVHKIGLEADTNASHTRRILLLEESVSILDEALHQALLESILQRYLSGREPTFAGVPRFLLNDVVRYWRTIAVDYQAKSMAGTPYSLRYLKLIVSRKVTYAASIAPLVWAGLEKPADLQVHLAEQYSRPALVRFVDFLNDLIERDVGLTSPASQILMDIDKFNGWLGDDEWRAMIARECESDDPKAEPLFSEARDLGRSVQSQLKEIFFSRVLRDLSEELLVF